jgi:hypothetical protein
LTDDAAKKGWNNVFRTCGRDDAQGTFAGKYLADHYKGKRVAIVHEGTAYGKGIAQETMKAMNTAGLKQTMYEVVTQGDKDLSVLISEMKEANIGDVSLCIPSPNGYDGNALGPSHFDRPSHGLWSLWEMLEFGSHAFYVSTYALTHMQEVIRSLINTPPTYAHAAETIIDDDSAKFIVMGIDSLIPQLRIINASLTIKEVERLRTDASFAPLSINFGKVAASIEDIIKRLADELSLSKMFVLEPDRQKYYDSANLFGVDFAAKFATDGAFELDEAAKCLAFGRATACVFHLMRLMEIAVRATARCLGIADPIQPADRNWGAVLKKVREGIDARWPTVAARATGDGEFFDALHASLDAVKNPWRNSTMHPANKYTNEEADHVFAAVRGFMMKLASRCDENGDPKA